MKGALINPKRGWQGPPPGQPLASQVPPLGGQEEPIKLFNHLSDNL